MQNPFYRFLDFLFLISKFCDSNSLVMEEQEERININKNIQKRAN